MMGSRLKHGVAHALAENAARGGHCCLTASELLEVLEKPSGPFKPQRGQKTPSSGGWGFFAVIGHSCAGHYTVIFRLIGNFDVGAQHCE